MGRFGKASDLARRQQSRFAAVHMTAIEGHRDIAIQGLQDYRELTSGRLTKRQTRGAFARGQSPAKSTPTGTRRRLTTRQLKNRGLKGAIPLLPVNVQSGRLLRSMRLRQVPGGVQSFVVGPTSAAGRSMFVLTPGGTRRMVSRGVHDEVKRRFRARNLAWQRSFIQKQRIQ